MRFSRKKEISKNFFSKKIDGQTKNEKDRSQDHIIALLPLTAELVKGGKRKDCLSSFKRSDQQMRE